MTLSTLLELAVGLVVFFYVLSLIVQAITGKIDEWLGYRAKDLEEGLRELLAGEIDDGDSSKKDLFQAFKENPLIQNLVPRPPNLTVRKMREGSDKDNIQMPGRIPAETFALALLNTLFPKEGEVTDLDKLRDAIKTLPDGDTKKSLMALIDSSDQTLQDARKQIENWYNDAMTRVSALYRVHMRRITFVVAAILILVVDADTIAVAQRLWQEPTLRAAASAEAQMIIENEESDDDNAKTITSQIEKLDTLDFPIFVLWQGNNWQDVNNWFRHLPGWIITWFALSLGASFWYDLLKQVKGENKGNSSEGG